MNYGELLTKAWKIIWKHKVLWIFGILAGCGSAGGNSGGGGQGNVNYQMDSNSYLPPQFQYYADQAQRFFENIPVWGWILLALGVLVIIIVSVLLTTIGRIGLVNGTNQVEDGATRLSFGPLFSQSLPYFWRVFLMNLLVGLALFIVILIGLLPMIIFGVATAGIGMLCLVPFFCLLVPVMWVVNLVIEQSNIAIVTENLGILAGLRRGWEVVTRNLGTYLVMLIILGILGFIASLVAGLPIVLIVLPGVIGVISGGDAASGAVMVSLALFCIYLPILLLLNGIIQAYLATTWTLTFRRVTGRGGNAAAAVVDVIPAPPAEEPPAPSPVL